MAVLTIPAVNVAGIASAVPQNTVGTSDFVPSFGEQDCRRVASSIGVSQRRIASSGTCASDLCLAAARQLLESLNWEAESIGALIFVSQTPDHLMPATSCLLHGALGLPKSCAAFDINLGCSGYVYGLSVAAQYAASLDQERVLLLAGDTLSRVVSAEDRSTAMLFGDAGSATAIERQADASGLSFCLGTDGAGACHIMVRAGMFREPANAENARRVDCDGGNRRSPQEMTMNGPEVFAFTLGETPRLIQQAMQTVGWTWDDIDGLVMHQANEFMLKQIGRRVEVPKDKLIVSLDAYGNTSSASIPLAITDTWSCESGPRDLRLMLTGFGVGWSWGTAAANCQSIVLPKLVEVPDAPSMEYRAA